MKSEQARKQSYAPTWRVLPRPETVSELVESIADSQITCVIGPHGVGKTDHSLAAIERFSSDTPVLVVGPTSQLSPRQLVDAMRSLDGGQCLVLVDKPEQITDDLCAVLTEAVLENQCKLVVEATGLADLPGCLHGLVRRARRSSVVVPLLTQDEFHIELERYLDGPIPTDTSQFFWRATGGNQELAAIAATALRRNGELSMGKYAWSWKGPLVAPAPVRNHVERQFDVLTPVQQRFLQRVSVVGSIPVVTASSFIDDDSLSSLGRAGFVTSKERLDGVAIVQMAAPLFGWVVEREVLPGRRREFFADVAVPERDREDPQAILQWTLNAMREGTELSAEQVILANESAFTTLSFTLIEKFVDVLLPANKTAPEIVQQIGDLPPAKRNATIFALLQRALASYFLDMNARARADVRIARSVIDQAPAECTPMLYHIANMDALVYRAEGNQAGSDAMLRADLLRAQELGAQTVVDYCQLQLLKQDGRDLLSRSSLEEAVAALNSSIDRSHFAINLAPSVAFRLAMSGRFKQSLELFASLFARRELRITNLPENDLAIAYSQTVVKHFYVQVLAGNPEAGLERAREPIAHTIVDPGALQTLTGFALISQGSWELALHNLRAALQRFANRDQNRTAKQALAGYVQVLAHLRRVPEAIAALKEYRDMALYDNAVYESDLEYRILTAEYALGLDTLELELDRLIERCIHAGEWYGVLRSAHLGVVAFGHDRYEEWLHEAALWVDDDRAEPFVRDAAAVLDGDSVAMIGTRAALAEHGAWIPQPQAPLVLSKRQREIAEYVTAGLANKEIAERLHLSVRTVESHVAAVLMKVGATDRRNLASKLAVLL